MEVKHAKIAVFSVLAFLVIYNLLSPLVYAIVLAHLARPFYNRLNKYLKHKSASAGLITAGVFMVIIYPVIAAIKFLVLNAASIDSFLSAALGGILAGLNYLGIGINSGVSEAFAVRFFSAMSGFLLATPKILIELVVLLAMIFYFLRDGPKIKKYLHSLATNKTQTSILNSTEQVLHAIIYGYLATAIIVGLLAWFGFYFLGYQYALLLGILVGIGALLPIIGPWVAYMPVVIYELVNANYWMVAAVLVFGIILEILSIYIGPKFSSHKTRIHPGIMLLGFLGGPLIFGVKGIILGPLILGVLKVLLDHYKQKD